MPLNGLLYPELELETPSNIIILIRQYVAHLQNYSDFWLKFRYRKLDWDYILIAPSGIGLSDDVNLIGDDIRTIERNADVLLNACKDIGLAVNIRKTKYMEIFLIIIVQDQDR